jgi:short-subunit dehydrogenase
LLRTAGCVATILANRAGATQGGPFLEHDDAVWEDGLALKFYASVRLSRLLRLMLRQSHRAMVNIIGGFVRHRAVAAAQIVGRRPRIP